jgi:hypothetical protein
MGARGHLNQINMNLWYPELKMCHIKIFPTSFRNHISLTIKSKFASSEGFIDFRGEGKDVKVRYVKYNFN